MPAPTVGTPTINSNWRVDVDPAGNNTFTQLKGITAFTPAVNPTTQDASDFDSGAWGADAVTQRKWQLQATVGRKDYPTSYDPGQELLRAAADSLAVVHVRWYEQVVGGEAYDGWALVQWEPQGGDGTSLKTVNITLLGQGARAAITNPWNVGTVPIISSVSPATGLAAGGYQVQILGSGFTGTVPTTGVKFGGTNATAWTVVNDGLIVATVPAHTVGVVVVLVTNATGASTTGTTAFTYV